MHVEATTRRRFYYEILHLGIGSYSLVLLLGFLCWVAFQNFFLRLCTIVNKIFLCLGYSLGKFSTYSTFIWSSGLITGIGLLVR